MTKNMGDTVTVDFNVTDTSGAQLDEFICTVYLLDPHKRERNSDSNPSRLGRGKYRSRLQIPKSGLSGVWRVKIRVTWDGEQETELLTFYVNP